MGKRGAFVPFPWKCCKVFLCIRSYSKTLSRWIIYALFSHLSSASGASFQDPTGAPPWTPLGGFHPHTHNFLTPGKNPAGAHRYYTNYAQYTAESSILSRWTPSLTESMITTGRIYSLNVCDATSERRLSNFREYLVFWFYFTVLLFVTFSTYFTAGLLYCAASLAWCTLGRALTTFRLADWLTDCMTVKKHLYKRIEVTPKWNI